jgi:hypothetical protein
MDTVNTLSVPIQYTFYPPLSSPLPFSSPSSPTHRYKVKIYRNLKGTKYSSQVQNIVQGGSDKSGIFFFLLSNDTAQLKIIRFD